jgi:NAD(P)-dependent dehydrogenase (short-subunit alcohol dehydrogenase family)
MGVVIVTGSSTGIGLATALHFARAGHRVHAAVRTPDTATELRGAVDAERLPVRIVTLDVDDATSVERAVHQVLDEAGRVDVLVNNAGIGGGGAIEDVPVEWAKTLFETNYFGVIRMTQAVLPAMRRQRGGAIVNVSSIMGRVAVAGHGHYCAAKHALEAASEALAQEVQAFGIRVAIVEPGVVRTPIFSKARRFTPPDSPYGEHVRRLLLFYQMQSKHASQPADAAAVIVEAATTTRPRLRWRVGEDARLLDEGRRRMSDEEYIAGARPMPDAEYIAEVARRYGFTWTP